MNKRQNIKITRLFRSVYTRLALLLVCLLIPLILLLIFSSLRTTNIVLNELAATRQRQTAFYTQNIDHGMSDAALYLANLQVNDSDYELLATDGVSESAWQLAYVRLNRRIAAAAALYPVVDSFFFYDAGRDFFSPISSTQSSYALKEGVHSRLRAMAESKSPLNFAALTEWEPLAIDGGTCFLRVLRQGGRFLGAWTKAEPLLAAYEQQLGDSPGSAGYTNADGFLMAADGLDTDADVILTEKLSSGYRAVVGGVRSLIVGTPSEAGPFSLVDIVPERELAGQLPWIQHLSRILSFLLLALVPLSILILMRIIRRPLRTMTESMHRIRSGDLDERIPDGRMPEEFQLVTRTFNDMMDQIKSLKIRLYEDEIARQNETLVYLEQQVKPHFYLNTLNMIHTLARQKKPDLIRELSMCLIRYFRYMFNESTFAALADELGHVRNYLQLQELRFPDSFRYEIDVPAVLDSVQVPFLLIQGFVENAVKYALSLDELTVLTIRAEAQRDSFRITVADNGPGFAPEVLGKIREGTLIEDEERRHLGIWNACRRIALLYRGRGQICFGNLDPHGACVEMTLPYLGDGDGETAATV